MPFSSTGVVPTNWSDHHRATASGGMNATCELQAPGGQSTYDPTTGSSTVDRGEPEWSGACRVQSDLGTFSDGDQAGQNVTSRGYLVQLDETNTPTPLTLAPGWLLKVTAAVNDEALVGRILAVKDVQYGSERFTRDVMCDDNQG